MIMNSERIVHKANLIDQHGNASALCFKKPHAINMKTESYVTSAANDKNVTCPNCRKILDSKDRV